MRIEEEACYQIRLGAHVVVQLPVQLVRSAIEGSVSNGAFLTYAALFAISDDDLARPLEEIAKVRGITSRSLLAHSSQLEQAGWLDRDVPALDQDDRPVQRTIALRFAPRTEEAA